VAKEAVKISLGLQDKLYLGNLYSTRDWGHAKDYVEAMWLMLQAETPDDFICATGISKSVKELVEYVFSKLDLDMEKHLVIDKKYFRPEELHNLKGDATKAKKILNWVPKITFEEMMDEMIKYWKNYYK
jgi:GDPmannose 4,6-dehydratase